VWRCVESRPVVLNDLAKPRQALAQSCRKRVMSLLDKAFAGDGGGDRLASTVWSARTDTRRTR